MRVRISVESNNRIPLQETDLLRFNRQNKKSRTESTLAPILRQECFDGEQGDTFRHPWGGSSVSRNDKGFLFLLASRDQFRNGVLKSTNESTNGETTVILLLIYFVLKKECFDHVFRDGE